MRPPEKSQIMLYQLPKTHFRHFFRGYYSGLSIHHEGHEAHEEIYLRVLSLVHSKDKAKAVFLLKNEDYVFFTFYLPSCPS